MYYQGKKTKGKIHERSFHGFGGQIRKEVLKRTNLGIEIILDIGTGSGRNLRFIANILKDARIYSIDPSLKALETVKGVLKTESLDKQAELVCGVGENLPFRGGFCDLVFSVMSLHHISNIDAALQEMVWVLKDDGKLIVVDWTPIASKIMNQPPSHFLPVEIFQNKVDKLGLCCQIEGFPTWYISEVKKLGCD